MKTALKIIATLFLLGFGVLATLYVLPLFFLVYGMWAFFPFALLWAGLIVVVYCIWTGISL